MAISGLFTTLGISKTIDAANNEGFYVYPLKFGVSDIAGSLDPSRTDANAGLWYEEVISSRVVLNANTIKFICTIPQGVGSTQKDIKEIYLFGEDSGAVEFLLALGQPTENLIYDPDGTTTLELQVSLVDIDLTSAYIFNNTMAVELDEHESAPDAHPQIVEAMAKAGIFVTGGALPFEHKGQNYDEPVEFDGTKATANTVGGRTISAVYNGTEQNNLVVEFDGIKTLDEVVTDFNAANPDTPIKHNGTGSEVESVGSVTLLGGTYLVEDRRNVYKDAADGIYKMGIADNTNKAKAIGMCKLADRRVTFNGLIYYPNSYAISEVLYLSSVTAGRFGTINNGINLGIVIDSETILYTGFKGATDVQVSQTFDAIVTDVIGAGLFTTTQDAIDYVPNNGRILIDKMEYLRETIDTSGKTLDIVFNGVDKGWKKYLGQVASFRIDFTEVPTQGNWRIEWNGQESAVLPYNANAALVESEFNLFSGHTGVTVTGDYSVGFTVEFLDEIPQPLPTFAFAGLNEIQKMSFSATPNDGTMRLSFEGEDTLNFPWDDSAADLKIALEALSTIDEIDVTGSFAAKYFEFEFTGNWFTNGLMPRDTMVLEASDLADSLVEILIDGQTPSVDAPFDITTIQQGKYPSSNLWNALNQSIAISATVVQDGQSVGPDTAIVLDAPNISITGLGLIDDFDLGIDVNNQEEAIIATRFTNTALPIKTGDRLPGLTIDTAEVMGYAKDIFAQMKLTAHPTNKRRIKVSTADVMLPNGTKLAQELNGLLMDWDGAEIDFSTGVVHGSDGISVIGQNFTPVVPAALQYQWASITVLPSSVTAEGRITGQVLVNFGSVTAAIRENAERAAFPVGKPIGQVAIKGDIGLQEISRVVCTRDEFSSLDGAFIVISDDVGTVGIWNNMTGTTPEPAHGADRSLEVTGMPENSSPNTVATFYGDVINADPKFSVVRTENRLVITDATIGPRDDATDGNSPFFVDTLQQGRDTDPTGLAEIGNEDIVQLGMGAGGSGRGTITVDFYNPVSTSLPTGTTVDIDGVAGENGDTVLFSNLSVDDNRVYELGGVGVAITWTPVFIFANGLDPVDGEDVRIIEGDAFGGQKAYFDGTEWSVNPIFRMFDGPNFSEWTAIKSSILNDDDTGSIFQVAFAGSENMILDYSLVRAGNKETGVMVISTDGVNAGVARYNVSVTGHIGVDFDAEILGSDIRLFYVSDDSGGESTLKYTLRRWSDSAGGPTGIPSYTGGSSSTVSAAGAVGDIQFHGPSGFLDADVAMKYDSTRKTINLDGLHVGKLYGPITINDAQSSTALLASFDSADQEFMIVEYSIKRGTTCRTGRLLIATNGTDVEFSDDYTEFGLTGVILTVVMNAGNIEVRYTSSSTGQTGEFKYSSRAWK